MRSPWNSMRTKIINPIVAKIRACLANKKWSLNFLHSSLITHFFTLIWQHHFYFHHLIFSHYLWVLHLSAGTFFFSSTQLTEANKKKNWTTNPGKEKEKKKKTNKQPTPTQKKKKSKSGQKLRLWVPYMCLITILLLSYELWKLKIAKVVFSFHNS